MRLDYVPLLRIQRDLHDLPRGMGRFQEYLRTIRSRDGNGLELPPLVIMNPMGKEHVAERLDALLAMDADGIGARVAEEASARLADVPEDFKATLVIADDLMGAGTNRFDCEYQFRFGPDRLRPRGPATPGDSPPPRWSEHHWITGVLWSSEVPSEPAVREALLTVAHRVAYVQRHGPARTLREMLAQEGHVMAMAGCTEPELDAEDFAYTREVLTGFLDADDKRTAIECLFGDAAARTLGFTPRGLSPWAGLALALHDARRGLPPQPRTSAP